MNISTSPPFQLSELIDKNRLQSLLEILYKASGIPSGIIDIDGNILAGAGWQNACTNFHRVNPISCKLCVQSDTQLASETIKLLDEQGNENSNFASYKCHNGLWDIAIPIQIEGWHLGNYFLGQFFYDYEVIDLEFFSNQAKKYNYDEESYLDAIKSIPVFSEEKVQSIMDFNRQFVEYLCDMGNQKLSNQKLLKQLALQKQDLLIHDNKLLENLKGDETFYNIDKEEFRGIIHDLKVPMNGIFGFAEMIEDSINEEQSQSVKEYLDLLFQSSSKMLEQIDSILYLSESEEDELEESLTQVKLSNLQSILYDKFANISKQRDIQLDFSWEPQLEFMINLRLLEVIFDNLVSNSLKYCSSGTTITFKSKIYDERIDLSVIDDGPGILPKEGTITF